MKAEKSCATCRHSYKVKYDSAGRRMVSPYSKGMGYCDKIEGMGFIPRKKPDSSLPEVECWEARETK
jgi:hypothetical protein